MRKLLLAMLMVFALALSASAQTKITGKAHCAKEDPSYSIDVGDKPGHTLMAQKRACNWTTPLEIAGSKTKDGTDVETAEMSGASIHDSGYHTATMDNGDKFTVHFWGSMKLNKDNTGTFDGKWSFVSGTGKLRRIKGSGTYKGTAGADGSSDVDVEGEYTIPAAAAAPAKKAPAKKSM